MLQNSFGQKEQYLYQFRLHLILTRKVLPVMQSLLIPYAKQYPNRGQPHHPPSPQDHRSWYKYPCRWQYRIPLHPVLLGWCLLLQYLQRGSQTQPFLRLYRKHFWHYSLLSRGQG